VYPVVIVSIAAVAAVWLVLKNLRHWRADLSATEYEARKARLADIGARLKQGLINDAQADAERLLLLTEPARSKWSNWKTLLYRPWQVSELAAVFVIVSGLVLAAAFVAKAPMAGRTVVAQPGSSGSAEALEQLAAYVSASGGAASSEPEPRDLLPDVNVMIGRLEARLQANPQDIEGWKMLGWSYFQTENYAQAENALGRALALDPGSEELKQAYAEARARSLSPASAVTQSGALPSAQGDAASDAADGLQGNAAIRSMVERLDQRLVATPGDAGGWIQLMRSRRVLGEDALAEEAYGRAVAAFAGDPAATSRINAAARELGIKVQ
jgi:cytochrome c-type biogenesis protein CcmH